MREELNKSELAELDMFINIFESEAKDKQKFKKDLHHPNAQKMSERFLKHTILNQIKMILRLMRKLI